MGEIILHEKIIWTSFKWWNMFYLLLNSFREKCQTILLYFVVASPVFFKN